MEHKAAGAVGPWWPFGGSIGCGAQILAESSPWSRCARVAGPSGDLPGAGLRVRVAEWAVRRAPYRHAPDALPPPVGPQVGRRVRCLCARARTRTRPGAASRRVGLRTLERWRRPVPAGCVHDPTDLAVVYGSQRTDQSQHREPSGRPQPYEPVSVLRLDASQEPVRHPGCRRRRSDRLDGRHAALRRQPVRSRRQSQLRRDATFGRHEPPRDEPAGWAVRQPRRARLAPDRLHRDGRPGGHDPVHDHQRAGRRAPLRPPEQERL